jgi:hypothetical protein
LDLSLIAVNLNMLRNTQLRVSARQLCVFLNFEIRVQDDPGARGLLLPAAVFWMTFRCVLFAFASHDLFGNCDDWIGAIQSNSLTRPRLAFCSTIHLAAFLLPVAAYNGRIDRLQVCASRRIKAPFFAPKIQTSVQFVLNAYCARLSGLGSPPLVDFAGWTRPLGKNFLISTQVKV